MEYYLAYVLFIMGKLFGSYPTFANIVSYCLKQRIARFPVIFGNARWTTFFKLKFRVFIPLLSLSSFEECISYAWLFKPNFLFKLILNSNFLQTFESTLAYSGWFRIRDGNIPLIFPALQFHCVLREDRGVTINSSGFAKLTTSDIHRELSQVMKIHL